MEVSKTLAVVGWKEVVVVRLGKGLTDVKMWLRCPKAQVRIKLKEVEFVNNKK